jgi:non-specific serine/threonine protein kinase
MEEHHDPNLFRLEGGIWTIRFGKKTVHHRDLLGFKCIAEVLALKGKSIDAFELRKIVNKSTRMGLEPLPGIPMVDSLTVEKYRKDYEEAQGLLEQARSNQDKEAAEKQQLRLKSILDQIEKTKKKGTKGVRETNGDREKARISITKAIGKAIDRIAPNHPELVSLF